MLQAQLPAGWTVVDASGGAGGALPSFRATDPDGGGGGTQVRVRARVTLTPNPNLGPNHGGTQEEHPLLPALLEARDVMRRRLRLRFRAFRDLEPVWLFAQPQRAQVTLTLTLTP